MPLFICSKCNCIENTATSGYWFTLGTDKPPLCSLCDPEIGKWHGLFSRDQWDGKEKVLNPPAPAPTNQARRKRNED